MLEFEALLARIEELAAAGGRACYDADDHYRWVIYRPWVTVGNQADTYATLAGAYSEP